MNYLATILMFLTYIGSAPQALACASCGSGGGDPLVLYPNEINKTYLGLSRISGIRNTDTEGNRVGSGGPESQRSLTLALGRRLTSRSFFTLTVPFMENTHASRRERGTGDPRIGGRYTFLRQNLAYPSKPQLQGVASYKHAQAKSLNETSDQDVVFGNGHDEMLLGADLWFGMLPLQPGVAQSITIFREAHFDGIKKKQGNIYTTTLSTAMTYWRSKLKTTAGLSRAYQERRLSRGLKVANSDSLSYTTFLTQDIKATQEDAIKLTLSQKNGWLRSKNSSFQNNLTLAYMRLF